MLIMTNLPRVRDQRRAAQAPRVVLGSAAARLEVAWADDRLHCVVSAGDLRVCVCQPHVYMEMSACGHSEN
jgi:uncharacterized Zn-finger protein